MIGPQDRAMQNDAPVDCVDAPPASVMRNSGRTLCRPDRRPGPIVAAKARTLIGSGMRARAARGQTRFLDPCDHPLSVRSTHTRALLDTTRTSWKAVQRTSVRYANEETLLSTRNLADEDLTNAVL